VALVALARPDPFCANEVALAVSLAKAVALAVEFSTKLVALVALVALARPDPFWAKLDALAVSLARAVVLAPSSTIVNKSLAGLWYTCL